MIANIATEGQPNEIQFDQFAQLLRARAEQMNYDEQTPEERLRLAFEAFDKEQDGNISVEELRQVMEKFGVTPKELEKLVEAVGRHAQQFGNCLLLVLFYWHLSIYRK